MRRPEAEGDPVKGQGSSACPQQNMAGTFIHDIRDSGGNQNEDERLGNLDSTEKRTVEHFKEPLIQNEPNDLREDD